MNSILLSQLVQKVQLHNLFKEKLNFLEEKVNSIFNKKNQEIEIFHLGGIKNPVFDPENKFKNLDFENYFYERIPIVTDEGEIHIYGNKLKKYVLRWMDETRTKKTSDSFQTWIQKKASTPEMKKITKKNSVCYFSDQEKVNTEVSIDREGHLTQIGLDTSTNKQEKFAPGEYIFVFGEVFDESKVECRKKFYAAPKMNWKNGKIQHSTFLNSGSVIAAGKLRVTEKGEYFIRNRSGHYKPTQKELAYFVQYLINQGVDTSKMNIEYQPSKLLLVASNFLHIEITRGMKSENLKYWFENTGKQLIS